MASTALKAKQPKQPGQPNQPGQQTHSVRRGDQVYFTGPAGVNVGRVLCHGKHGATLDCQGQRTPVRWEHLLGHKERVSYRARVIDQGEDGMVVEDDSGERSFLAGQLPEPEPTEPPTEPQDQPQQEPENALYDQSLVERKPQSEWDKMSKAMPVLFFLKGGQDDKPGRQVAFHHHATGEKTVGEIAATGKDGVTVEDDEGQEHHVKHGDYHPHVGDAPDKPDEKPDEKPTEKPSDQSDEDDKDTKPAADEDKAPEPDDSKDEDEQNEDEEDDDDEKPALRKSLHTGRRQAAEKPLILIW